MPIYEYVCRKCSHGFEQLVFQRTDASCPQCKTEDVERVMSVTAIGSSTKEAAPAPMGCGRCGDPRGPGSCARN